MATAEKEKKPKIRRSREQVWSAYLFLLPSVLIFATFVAFPVLFTLYISFHDWPLLAGAEATKPYVGIENYRNVIANEDFRNAFWNTVYYVIGAVPTGLVIALGLALLMNAGLRGVTFYRTAFFTPVVTAGVAVGLIWRWVLNTDWGLLNYALMGLGDLVGLDIPKIAWLDSTKLAMPAIIIASIWRGVGWSMVIFLAGLQGIPEHLYEAARLDGAGAWRQFRHITFPLLFPSIFFVLVMSIIGSFQVFDLVYIMTGGGPLKSTDVVIFYLFQWAFQRFQLGYAAAVSYILFAVIFMLTLIQMRVFGRRIQYEV